MLKFLQARLKQYVNCEYCECEYSHSHSNVNIELPDVQSGFRKGRGIRNQIANIRWIIKKTKEISISALLTMPKPLTVWITINCGKF